MSAGGTHSEGYGWCLAGLAMFVINIAGIVGAVVRSDVTWGIFATAGAMCSAFLAVRDGYRCALAGVAGAGECFGRPTFQHRRKASQGGAYDEANGATLCSFHNQRIEADADLAALARSLGLVLLRGDL